MAKNYNKKAVTPTPPAKERMPESKTAVIQKVLKRRKKVDIGFAERFNPPPEKGLSFSQVQSRIANGYVNVVSSSRGKSYGRIIFSNFFTYLNILSFAIFAAIVIAAINAGQSDYWSQCLFVIIIVINTVIGIAQECRSKFTVDKLKLITAPTALVVRDGETISIPVSEVVLDDIVYLEMGKQISADAVIVSGEAEVNESMITGESVPISKKTDRKSVV